jgi:hypothetical protein
MSMAKIRIQLVLVAAIPSTDSQNPVSIICRKR